LDLSQLTRAERFIAGGGLAMLAVSFFPWFRMGAFTVNAWDNLLSALAVLVALSMTLQVLTSRFGTVRMPRLPVAWGQVHVVTAAAVFGMVTLQFAMGDDLEPFGLRLDPAFGIFLAGAASLAMLYGGVLSLRASGERGPRRPF